MLSFVFKDNGKIVYDGKYDFVMQNDKIEFVCDNSKFTFKFDGNNLYFTKEDNNYIFTLTENNLFKTSNIYIKDKDMIVDIGVLSLSYIYNNDYIKIEYILESDEESLKSLEIRY